MRSNSAKSNWNRSHNITMRMLNSEGSDAVELQTERHLCEGKPTSLRMVDREQKEQNERRKYGYTKPTERPMEGSKPDIEDGNDYLGIYANITKIPTIKYIKKNKELEKLKNEILGKIAN